MNQLDKRIRDFSVKEITEVMEDNGIKFVQIKEKIVGYGWYALIKEPNSIAIICIDNKVTFGWNNLKNRPNLKGLRKLFPRHKLETHIKNNGNYELVYSCKDIEPIVTLIDSIKAFNYVLEMV